MPIVFEPKSKEYSPKFMEILNKYFIGKSFDSLKAALNQEYEPGHCLTELFEVSQVIRAFTPENLPATLEKAITEVDILWKQSESEGKGLISFSGLPVLRAKFVN